MGVYIKGMEMPKDGSWRSIRIYPDGTIGRPIGFGDYALVEGAKAIPAADVRPVKWIPVTERLPEDLTRVIVFCEDGVSYGLCEHLIAGDEEVVEWHDFLHYPSTPTHWMPLPEPPKEEKT